MGDRRDHRGTGSSATANSPRPVPPRTSTRFLLWRPWFPTTLRDAAAWPPASVADGRLDGGPYTPGGGDPALQTDELRRPRHLTCAPRGVTRNHRGVPRPGRRPALRGRDRRQPARSPRYNPAISGLNLYFQPSCISNGPGPGRTTGSRSTPAAPRTARRHRGADARREPLRSNLHLCRRWRYRRLEPSPAPPSATAGTLAARAPPGALRGRRVPHSRPRQGVTLPWP